MFEVFPDNPNDPTANGVRNLRLSLQRVLQHRVAETRGDSRSRHSPPRLRRWLVRVRLWSRPTRLYSRTTAKSPTSFIKSKTSRTSFTCSNAKVRTPERAENPQREEQMQGTLFLQTQQLLDANHANCATPATQRLNRARAELETRVQDRTACGCNKSVTHARVEGVERQHANQLLRRIARRKLRDHAGEYRRRGDRHRRAKECVTMMNPVARVAHRLVFGRRSWLTRLPKSIPHRSVRLTRRPVENPVDRVLAEGVVVGLANPHAPDLARWSGTTD